ncbi:MAG TPA: helix-turn-helix domain-containing protein [Gemmatimonadales bacterium]|jgi:DNA-binding response OmpR family regulator
MGLVLHVLVLERDAERRRFVGDALRAAGIRVFEAGDPGAAAASLDTAALDAAVVSLTWPELDAATFRAVICPSTPGLPVSLDAAERAHIARTLAHTAGNRRQAALLLGISRSTLLHKIRKYGLGDVRGQTRTDGDG